MPRSRRDRFSRFRASQSLIAPSRAPRGFYSTALLFAPVVLLLAIVSFTFVICLTPVYTNSSILRAQQPICNTASAQVPLFTAYGLLLTLAMQVSMGQTAHLVRAHEFSSDERLLLLARRTTVREILALVVLASYQILMVYHTFRTSGGVAACFRSIQLAWSCAMVVAMILMRVAILRRERTAMMTHLAKWQRRVTLVFVAQCCCLWYAVVVAGEVPLVFFHSYAEGTTNGPPLNCRGVINESYVDQYCSTRANGHMALDYECNDQPYGAYASLYTACAAKGHLREMATREASLDVISRYLPCFLLLNELRRGQRTIHCLSFLGDAAFCGLGVIVCICITTLAYPHALAQNWIIGYDSDVSCLVRVICVRRMLAALLLALTCNDLSAARALVRGQDVDNSVEMSALFTIALLLSVTATGCYCYAQIKRGVLQFVHGQSYTDERFAVFLSHDWGSDELGRDNHQRVFEVNRRLRAEGLRTWFDSERMVGDINAAMTHGIDCSETVIVFVTQAYIAKAAGRGPRGQMDNCCAECSYALNRRGVQRMVAVVMEPRALDTTTWSGVVGLRLGTTLYIDLSTDGPAFDEGVKALAARIREITTQSGQHSRPRPHIRRASSAQPNLDGGGDDPGLS